MAKKILFLIVVALSLISILKMGNKENKTSVVEVDPISHASIILNWDGVAIYADPSLYKVDKADAFTGKPDPDLILITDIHQDHFDVETIKSILKEKTIIVAPSVVAEKIPKELNAMVFVMNNGEVAEHLGFKIEAIPMYNLPGPSESYHTKGRGNGYVIEKDGTRIYISGDTAGISEMRSLKDIDMAFVAMNLPYTMDVAEAALAVLEFKPKKVYPYHYRTPEGFSDVAKFKEIVNKENSEIEVVQLEWYSK